MATPARTRYTPNSLLRVAVEVFNERGYDGTSMEHLARAAGITKSSIYHHVRGKEELLGLALDRATGALFGVLDEPAATTGPAVDRLRHVLHRAPDVLVAELPYVNLLLRARGNTDTERWALHRRREFDQRIAALVTAAAAEGDLRADIDPHLVTKLLFGMVNSITEWYRADHDTDWSEQLGATVATIAFDGLRRG
ncbi:MAG: TetR family transcriptional regulator [Streptosporangiales bacterium]|nr:TetR family transcriptional regulator [Streptosporangiales bacterium]